MKDPLLAPPRSASPHSPLNFVARESLFVDSISIPKIAFDIVTISSVAGLLLLSAVAFCAILHLLVKSRHAHHLRGFNVLWPVRLLLVSFASVWAANEILRLPSVRKKYLSPFLPPITQEQHAKICKLHVVLSLGFLEPGFLITLFFLIRVSIKKRKPRRLWSLVFILTLCFPIICLQTFFVYFYSFDGKSWAPNFMNIGTSSVTADGTVMCTYPFVSWAVFAAFAAAYGVAFLLSFWRVMAFVINKGIGHRVYLLTSTVMAAVPAQVLCICLSWLWMPDGVGYWCARLAVFLSVAWCMAVGEVLVVILPIRDSLAACGESARWRPAEDMEERPLKGRATEHD